MKNYNHNNNINENVFTRFYYIFTAYILFSVISPQIY